jgi:hypothetical protein
MREELLRAHPARLWIVLLPPMAGCVAAAWIIFHFPLASAPFLLASLTLAFALGVLAARALPRSKRLASTASQLQAIYTVISKAGGSLVLQEVLDSITRTTTEVTGVLGCSI